jgi:hypothetical protein
MNDVPKQIRCREHGLAPWGFVCVHLVTGASRKWVPAPLESGPGCENDWMCPACAATTEPTDHSLRLLCVHCIQAMRQRLDAKAAQGSPTPDQSRGPTTTRSGDGPSTTRLPKVPCPS